MLNDNRTTSPLITSLHRTFDIEIQALKATQQQCNKTFIDACNLLLNCQGRVVVMGMGKSGHIARKIAATLASTGTPSFFVHPAEASHGDLGMITSDDVILALSNSGTTVEILAILPVIKRIGSPLIAITGNEQSALATTANVHLNASVTQEACPHNLAPTASTTVALVLGDALAVALLEARGFSANDFAFSHPGGKLGRRLLLKASDVMHHGDDMPLVTDNTLLCDALLEMTRKGLGTVVVCNNNGKLCGIFTDGDLRRCLNNQIHLQTTRMSEVMTASTTTTTGDVLAVDALNMMQKNSITALVVINQAHQPIGLIHLHALLKAGVA